MKPPSSLKHVIYQMTDLQALDSFLPLVKVVMEKK